MKYILIALLLVSGVAMAQTYPPGYTGINSRYDWLAGKFRSLHLPTSNGYPSLTTGTWNGSGEVRYDTTNHRYYVRSGGVWRYLPDSSAVVAMIAAGGFDSLRRVGVNVQGRKGGNWFTQFTDSTGEGSEWSGKYFTVYISGQSNAKGASGATSLDTASNPRVKAWSNLPGSPGWVTARLNQSPFRYSDSRAGSANSAFYLAQRYARENPKDSVRILMAAYDGESIYQWYNLTDGPQQYMDSLLDKGDASGIDKVDLFIWDQGEGDSFSPNHLYLRAFDSIKTVLRREPWFPKTTPIVVSGLPLTEYGANPLFNEKDTTLRKVDQNDDVWDGYADTKNLVIANDEIHWDSTSLYILGRERYWQTWKSLPSRYIENNKDLQPSSGGGGGGTTLVSKYIEFKVGDTGYPAVGDSIMIRSDFEDKRLFVFRGGERMSRDSIFGVTYSNDTLKFHPVLTSNERIIVEAQPDSLWSVIEAPPLPGLADITFSPQTDLVNTTGVWTTSSTNGSFGHTGVGTVTLTGDGWIQFKCGTSADGGFLLGFNTTSTQEGWTNFPYAVFLDQGTRDVYRAATGNLLSLSHTLAVNSFIRLKRTSGVFTIDYSADELSWTNLYTFTTPNSSTMYVKVDVAGATTSKLTFPKIYQ